MQETSPFKLSEEMVEVMGGVDSTMYYYFKALLLRGFLEVRKYADKIVLLVEMSYCGMLFHSLFILALT